MRTRSSRIPAAFSSSRIYGTVRWAGVGRVRSSINMAALSRPRASSCRGGLPRGVALNVNVPYLPEEQIQGLRFTRQGSRVYRQQLDRREDPRGRPYYWIGGEAPGGVPEEGTDVGALSAGAASVTPLHLDLTAYQALEQLRGWQLDLEGERG